MAAFRAPTVADQLAELRRTSVVGSHAGIAGSRRGSWLSGLRTCVMDRYQDLINSPTPVTPARRLGQVDELVRTGGDG
ncbi:hypothetical protein GCM10027452_01610 [Micromonospora halotolerans]